ncbi:MAG TPA: hypothetical protein VFG22_07995 [Polyangiales bacterium]|nr:hypothetical protein [Polyangiales bacterium]
MERVTDWPTSTYVEIDHPWISNDETPLYRWTFPEASTDEELHACLAAPQGVAGTPEEIMVAGGHGGFLTTCANWFGL